MKSARWINPDGKETVVENPTQDIIAAISRRVREDWEKERENFIEEVIVALRKLTPGQKRIVLSKPLRVVMSQSEDNEGDLEYQSWGA